MKTIKRIQNSKFIKSKASLWGGLVGALLLTSCYQPKVVMHTSIRDNKKVDGALYRRDVTYSNVMSKEMRDSVRSKNHGQMGWSEPLPECLNVDGIMASMTEIKDDTVTSHLTIFFDSVKEMSEGTPLQLNGKKLRSDVKLDKRFRWFYTEYVYTETFCCVGDSFKLAPTDYADKDAVSYWFTGQPNLLQGLNGAEAYEKLGNMEPAVTKWLNDNLFKVGFDFIVAHYDSIPNPPVSRERFIELQDSLVHFIMEGEEDILTSQPDDKLRSFFHSDAYAMFFDEDNPLGEELNREFMNRLNIFWFNVPYTLTMPGKVTDTGNGTLQPDGTIFYPFTGERLIPQDYTITATSRVTHIWAYIVTLLVIFLAIGSFLYCRKR